MNNIMQVGEKCCACRACENVCPKGAITFQNDKYGFEYPRVDEKKCVECGLCERVCPSLNVPENNMFVIGGAAYATDDKTRNQGSSGGIFGVLAREVIRQKGVVFGAAFDDELKLKTMSAETIDELQPLYKSKYLLCDTNSTFAETEKLLQSGRTVLYASSPCQISALKLYLKKDYENLLTAEFVCNGVGSREMFEKSVKYYENKHDIKIKKFVFRYKKRATSRCFETEYEKKGKTKRKSRYYFYFPYYYGYYKGFVKRKSCRNCMYATKNRVADITFGDFWEISKYNPEINREKGCSMLLINTPKGNEWFDKVREHLYFQEMDKQILYKNNRFTDEETRHSDDFLEFAVTNGFDAACEKYLNPRKEWKKYLYYSMPAWLNRLLKKIL